MGSGNAQIGWLATFSYVVASQKGYADVSLVTIRNGSDHYGFEIMLACRQRTSRQRDDAATALAAIQGQEAVLDRPAFVLRLCAPGRVLREVRSADQVR